MGSVHTTKHRGRCQHEECRFVVDGPSAFGQSQLHNSETGHRVVHETVFTFTWEARPATGDFRLTPNATNPNLT